MTPSVSQIIGSTYNVVLGDKRATNQWSESAFLRALEKKGFVKRVAGGSQIEDPLDWRANSGTAFLATDTTATSVSKTDVITGTVYDFAEIVVPITWTFRQEAENSSVNQKVDLAKALIQNAIDSHDDLIEQDLFSTVNSLFLGLQNIVPTTGQPNIGGINGATDAMWRNQTGTYTSDGSDMEAQMLSVYNKAAKGSGAALAPGLLVSGPTANALFESQLVSFQRFTDGDEASGGFTAIKFHNAPFVFSQYGETLTTNPVYFLNNQSFNLVVVKSAFRTLKEMVQIPAATAYNRKVYSLLQAKTNNVSRLGVITVA